MPTDRGRKHASKLHYIQRAKLRSTPHTHNQHPHSKHHTHHDTHTQTHQRTHASHQAANTTRTLRTYGGALQSKRTFDNKMQTQITVKDCKAIGLFKRHRVLRRPYNWGTSASSDQGQPIPFSESHVEGSHTHSHHT